MTEQVERESAGDQDDLSGRRAAAEAALRQELRSHPALPDPGASREQRMDAARYEEVLERELEAAVSYRPDEHEAPAGAVRTVVAHRNAWFRGKLVEALSSYGIVVVAQTEDGADAVGYCVAEQPDLLIVEDVLARLSGLDVVGRVDDLAPRTVCMAQVGYEDGIVAMLAAGCKAAWTRAVPPVELAQLISEAVKA